jgi:hypothetical protein
MQINETKSKEPKSFKVQRNKQRKESKITTKSLAITLSGEAFSLCLMDNHSKFSGKTPLARSKLLPLSLKKSHSRFPKSQQLLTLTKYD